MGLLDLIFNYWPWAVAFYVVAFAVTVALVVRSGLAVARSDLDSHSGTESDSGADSDSDADCRANLALAVNRRSGRRAIPNFDHWNPAGRRAADGDSVCADEKAVA